MKEVGEEDSSSVAIYPTVRFKECPIQASLGILGRKWTLMILRDIGFLKIERFNEILRATPGLTPRVLSMRLEELEKMGIIRKIEERNSPKIVRWGLTEMGYDTLPILMRFIAFGSKWYAQTVFEDRTPRTLKELFPQRIAQQYIRS